MPKTPGVPGSLEGRTTGGESKLSRVKKRYVRKVSIIPRIFWFKNVEEEENDVFPETVLSDKHRKLTKHVHTCVIWKDLVDPFALQTLLHTYGDRF